MDVDITWYVTYDKPRRATRHGRYTIAGTHVLHLPFQGSTSPRKRMDSRTQPPAPIDIVPMGSRLCRGFDRVITVPRQHNLTDIYPTGVRA
jgi:hypothetical protein